jgi:signal transduction histidine kinase
MADDAALLRAYAEADHDQRIRLSKVGCVMTLVMVLVFWGLDHLVYPALVAEFLMARVLCDLGILIVFGLLFTALGRSWIRFLGIAWAVFPGIGISWMVWRTSGEASPYYAGLNLVMIVVSLLMPWTAIEVAILCGLTIAWYTVACLLHSPGTAVDWPAMITNLYFMGTTALICIVAGFFAGRRRFAEFRLRHELDRRNRELAEVGRLKSEFYANVSHELRTPLTLVLAPLQRLLADGALGRSERETLELMRGNALRLLRLVNDILEVVRLDSGHIDLRRQRHDLSSWARGIAQSTRHLVEAKELTLETGPVDVDMPLPVDIDPLRMEKVLFNLLSNAIKFTPAGGKITVRWGRQGETAWIEVADTGIGIPADEMPKLFRRFHQADMSATRQFRGLGLGLSLSRDLAEQHGGRLTATSVPGSGSIFRVELPLVQAEAMPPHPDVAAAAGDFIVDAYRAADRSGHAIDTGTGPRLGEVIAPRRPGGGGLILVADDEPDMRRFLLDLLGERHQVVLAGDGEQAVELAGRHRPQLVLLDLMMPKLDGMETCRRIRADPACCDARIVLLTARADDDTKLQALEGGCDDFLTKPFSGQEVLSRARNLLENSALEQRMRERNRDLETAMGKLRQAEATLVQQEKMRAIGSLSAGLLHEINNPLNYALAAVQLARASAPTDNAELTEMLTDIHDGMRRIGDIITSLRSFAYPEQQNLASLFLVAEAVAVARRFSAGSFLGLTVEEQLQPGLQARGSLNQMSMVLVNLLSNAAKAIHKTGRTAGRIVIGSAGDAATVRLWVTDDGIGMDAEQAKRVFDPFYTTSEPGQGMGLGMAVCHTIVQNHHGTIGIDSRPGDGTTVRIELPVGGETQRHIPTENHGAGEAHG